MTATLEDDVYRYDAGEYYERDAYDPVRDAHKLEILDSMPPLPYPRLELGKGVFGSTVVEVGEHEPEG